MRIGEQEARAALAEIGRAEQRGKAARAYRGLGGILMLWGALWAAGYGLMAALPGVPWWWIWGPADVVGLAGSAWLGARARRQGEFAPGHAALMGAAVLAAVAGLYVVVPPRTALQGEALPALLVGLIYGLTGAPKLWRLAAIGLGLVVLTVLGVLTLEARAMAALLAVAGGGALALGGAWLRRG